MTLFFSLIAAEVEASVSASVLLFLLSFSCTDAGAGAVAAVTTLVVVVIAAHVRGGRSGSVTLPAHLTPRPRRHGARV